MEIEVKGHSGCQIEIVRENNDLFIYKSSKDPKYLVRLIKQAEKQQAAFRWEYQHIRVPEIYDVTYDSNHVSVKMEYVYSRNFIEHFEEAGFEQVNYFIKALILFVEKELRNSPIQSLPTAVTIDKFEDVKTKIKENRILYDDAEINELLHKAEERLVEFSKQKSIDIPLGVCHGDLTFSNILFNGNNYYLIDFLDSFIESPLIDVVKIRQDSAHLWSQLMYTKKYDKLRLKIICEKIDKDIDNYFNQYEWYREYYDIFQLMNVLRILQYAKDDEVVKYLKKIITEILYGKYLSDIKIKSSSKVKDSSFNLIVPVAADNTIDKMPNVFGLDDKGIMLCVKSVLGLDTNIFDNVYFTILKKHTELYNVDEMMRLQFRRLGLKNVQLVVLDGPTKSQAETIFQTIQRKNIKGSVFVKDADCYFKSEIIQGNSISVFPLEEMTIVDPQHKSYVSDDNMRYVTNIIERRVVGHLFNAGGYCFESAKDFENCYSHLIDLSDDIRLSHIVYWELLNSKKFVPISVQNYTDFSIDKRFI